MNPRVLWTVLFKNISLVLLMLAAAFPALEVGRAVYGAAWSSLVLVALVAALCGWWAGTSRLNGQQAAGRLVALGLPAVFIYNAGLFVPLGRLLSSVIFTIIQTAIWLFNRSPVDLNPVLTAWAGLSSRAIAILVRLWEWVVSLRNGQAVIDPDAAGLAWSMLLWLISSWAGWQLSHKRLALRALAPGGLVLALALEYRHGDANLLVIYLTILLVLTGLAHYKENLAQWAQRGVDYAESIAVDTALMAVPVIVLLVGGAMLTPSLSWRDLWDKLREPNRREEAQAAETRVFESRPNVANNEAYRSEGLPRLLLLNTPPELLDDLVMTVSVEEASSSSSVDSGVMRYYWRTVTYDLYTGTSWISRPAQETSLAAGTTLLEPAPNYRSVHQWIKLAPDQGRRVYWTGSLAQIDADIEIAWRIPPPSSPDPIHNGDLLGALTEASEYNILSYIPQASQTQLQTAGRAYPPEIANRYLYLPDSIPGRVTALAYDLTDMLATPYDQALAIESYLRQIPYTLEVTPPPYGRDAVDYFLFSLKKGYCDYYASSMVIMARAVGLPARIVVGYTTGDYNPATRQYLVRKRHAHTWAEIYFPDIGWVEFEPTGNQPLSPHSNSADESQLDSYQPPDTVVVPWLKIQWRIFISTLLGQAFLALLGLIGLLALWQAGNILNLHMLPSPMAVNRIYESLDNSTMQMLPGLSRGHTPLQLETALANKFSDRKTNALSKIVLAQMLLDARQLIALYMAQAYSSHPPMRLQVRRGIKTWARLHWKLWIVRFLTR